MPDYLPLSPSLKNKFPGLAAQIIHFKDVSIKREVEALEIGRASCRERV